MNTIKKSSQEWAEDYPELMIMDPDGWDRTNFEYSWHKDMISLQEFYQRVIRSTCLGSASDTLGFDKLQSDYDRLSANS